MSDVTDLLSQLVAIDSVNPDLVPGGAGEGELARFVASWLERAGLEVVLQETAPGRPNVIAAVKGTGGGRALMLNAHMDTVGYAGMERPLEPYVDGNRLYGRGAFDMKGSLAAIMLAAAELAKSPPRGHVLVTAVTDEEYASLGTAAVAGTWRADAAIVTEPTGLEVTVAHKGFVWLEIETRGLAAHGSLPEHGIDAIAKMGKVLVGVESLDHALRAAPAHPLLSSGSIHASTITGGVGWSTYPDRCRLQVERRTIPGETVEIVEGQLQGIIDGLAASDPAFTAAITRGLHRDPFEIATDEPIVQLVTKHATAVTGTTPIYSGGGGWMDSALLSAAGIPTVIFGPDGDGAHADVEWVNLDHVEQCRQVYFAVAREFCS